MADINLTTDAAEIITIDTNDHSFARFIISENGVLIVDSDWGLYSTRFGAKGGSMKEFIASCDSEYLTNKCQYPYNVSSKPIPKQFKVHIKALFEHLINHCKKS